MNDTVFLTGATGVLGKRVMNSLVNSGIHVVALSRSKDNDKVICDAEAEPRGGDLFTLKDMLEVTGDCNTIIHLATHIPRKAMPDKPGYWHMNDRIRTEGTNNLLKAAIENHIRKFITQSVTFVYGDKKGDLVTSGSTVTDRPPFMIRSAVEMENLIAEKKDVDHIVARFGQFYSADSFNTDQLIQNVKKRKMPVIGKGDFYWNTIHVDDAASAILYCFRHFNRLKNRTINFTDFHPVLFRSAIDDLARLTGSKKPPRLPSWLARIFLKKSMYDFITSSYRVTREDHIKGWEPEYPEFIEGMKEIILEKIRKERVG